MNFIKRRIQSLLRGLGIALISSTAHEILESQQMEGQGSDFLRRHEIYRRLGHELPAADFAALLRGSRAQLDQDVAALLASGVRRGGYFVEFGATNGLGLSNSYLLESEFQWTGILAEPSREWHHQLKLNRSASISHMAVWKESGEKLDFIESGELSTILSFREVDNHKRTGRQYQVETVTLRDLLIQFDAPKHIDFLSVDTEGSELEVLSAFDFSQYSFGFICVEHNFTPSRQKIQKLLESKGYAQILSEVSEWDDWFVPSPRL